MRSFLLAAILAVMLVQAYFLWGLTEYFGVFSWQRPNTSVSTEQYAPPVNTREDSMQQVIWEECAAKNNNRTVEVCGPPPWQYGDGGG
jgi:hypothetical protein